MVMDQFVTTYRKDYLWPYVRTFGVKPQADQLFKPQYRSGSGDDQALCPCHCIDAPLGQEERALLGPISAGKEGWSRLGPMGPLLDPKIYPARVGSAPEVDTQRFNQPNVFMQKLERKYPYLYEVLRTSPPDDIIARINRDRLRTTYQVDYCHMHEYPSLPYDELLRSAGVQGLAPCPEPARLPGDPCRPNQRSIAFRPAIISKERGLIGGFSRGGSGGSGGGGGGAFGGGSGGGGAFGGGGGGGGKGGGDKVDKVGESSSRATTSFDEESDYSKALEIYMPPEEDFSSNLSSDDECDTEDDCQNREFCEEGGNVIPPIQCLFFAIFKDPRNKRKSLEEIEELFPSWIQFLCWITDSDIPRTHSESTTEEALKLIEIEKKNSASCGGGLAGVTTGATEYQDAFSRLGDMIIRDKIHYGPRAVYRGNAGFSASIE